MAGNNSEKGMGRSKLTHVDLQTGTISGVPYIATVRGLGKNGLPFRAQPGHMSVDRLNQVGAKTNPQVKGK
ncbi:MAG: hypothetical protein AAB532_02865 [Patescibacteria group bacterium]